MKYQETVVQKIEYTNEDIISWVKIFAARQLGVTPDEISDDMIVKSMENMSVIVNYTKIKSS